MLTIDMGQSAGQKRKRKDDGSNDRRGPYIMWTRCGDFKRIALLNRMDLRELQTEPPHWRDLLVEMERLFELERLTVTRRRSDIEGLVQGLTALRGVMGAAKAVPACVMTAPACPSTDPRCACTRCKWKRVRRNLNVLCEEVPALMHPREAPKECVRCGGLLPPAPGTVARGQPMCLKCDGFVRP